MICCKIENNGHYKNLMQHKFAIINNIIFFGVADVNRMQWKSFEMK